ncbi:hypothetical protein BURK1_03301 [Burkholderiales bacterium]|nr:hypothetical protein BURK1_03301 [Burkholderiales bacterium]
MSRFTTVALLSAVLAAAWIHDARAAAKTVCTITINSPDEKESFRRHLPADRFTFVELVEEGRPDWLESARRAGIRCDVLVVSGHYDGGSVYFSDQTGAREHLPVDELERVSCSDAGDGLFSRLGEVYLFGCNTLNPGARKRPSCEVERSLIRSGHTPEDAARIVRTLAERHGESSRDRMRLIFAGVPVIYGFAASAPIGPVAGALLDGYFRAGGHRDTGSGKVSARLLERFRAHALVATRGVTAGDPEADYRRDVCTFADDRLSSSEKLAFVLRLLNRGMAEARLYLDRIEALVATVGDADRRSPSVASSLEAIANDLAIRDRFLIFARDADLLPVRARMFALAERLGWLTRAEARAELVRLIAGRLAADDLGEADVDLVCTLNRDRQLDAERQHLERPAQPPGGVAGWAVLACLGSGAGHARTIEALTGAREADARLAQVYLHHRPIDDAIELRTAVDGIARMKDAPAQVRALGAIARQGVSDRESVEALVRVYALAGSADVQSAAAGVLIRSDVDSIGRPALLDKLRRHRIASAGGQTLVDVLIRRLERR